MLGDEEEVDSRTKQQGQVGHRKHNRDWRTLQADRVHPPRFFRNVTVVLPQVGMRGATSSRLVEASTPR
jgi:hypothetical protein